VRLTALASDQPAEWGGAFGLRPSP
jgi:hypothetical protein